MIQFITDKSDLKTCVLGLKTLDTVAAVTSLFVFVKHASLLSKELTFLFSCAFTAVGVVPFGGRKNTLCIVQIIFYF